MTLIAAADRRMERRPEDASELSCISEQPADYDAAGQGPG